MDLKQHYTVLYNESIKKIVTGFYQIDNHIASFSDNQREQFLKELHKFKSS